MARRGRVGPHRRAPDRRDRSANRRGASRLPRDRERRNDAGQCQTDCVHPGAARRQIHQELLSRDAFFAVVDEAKKHDLAVVAHVPLSVLAGEASDAGVRSFEHLRNIEFACSREAETLLAERIALLEAGAGRIGAELRAEIHSAQRARALDTYDPERCTALLRKFAANGTLQTPTLFINEREARRARYADWAVQLVRRMNEEGVGLLAGTDVANTWTVPGAALHEELNALVEAGLTPLESLRTATLNPARYFNKTGEFGHIARGMVADLVLIDGDPLADIRNARRISGVVANGRYLDRPALDRMLAGLERMARGAGHDSIHRPPATAAEQIIRNEKEKR